MDHEICRLNADGMWWRHRFRERFDAITKHYPPRGDVDLDALADMAQRSSKAG